MKYLKFFEQQESITKDILLDFLMYASFILIDIKVKEEYDIHKITTKIRHSGYDVTYDPYNLKSPIKDINNIYDFVISDREMVLKINTLYKYLLNRYSKYPNPMELEDVFIDLIDDGDIILLCPVYSDSKLTIDIEIEKKMDSLDRVESAINRLNKIYNINLKVIDKYPVGVYLKVEYSTDHFDLY